MGQKLTVIMKKKKKMFRTWISHAIFIQQRTKAIEISDS